MPKYKLKFLEPDSSLAEEELRHKTLSEISTFIESMLGRVLAVVTLDEEQSARWDQHGEFDYQNYYGQAIVEQVADGRTQTLVIRNTQGLPVALASCDNHSNWQGLGIDKRLREAVAQMLHIPEQDLC